MLTSVVRKGLSGAVAAAAVAAVALVPVAGSAQEVPVAHPPLPRGTIETAPAPDRMPTPKVVDGDPSEWIGEPTWLGGQSRYDAGELVYTDYPWDAWGADDGADAARLQLIGPSGDRLYRLNALAQAMGALGVPAPLGTYTRYGNVDGRLIGDLAEVRAAVQGDRLVLLLRYVVLTEQTVAEGGVRVVADGTTYDVPLAGPAPAGVSLAVDPETDAVELSLPAADTLAVVTYRVEDGALLNAAFRPDEPVSGEYNDQQQAIALLNGELPFVAELDLAGMASGRTDSFSLGPGYHERVFLSDPAISREEVVQQGVWQRYGLYVSLDADLSQPVPLVWNYHGAPGAAHTNPAWMPDMIRDLADGAGAVLVSPEGRGPFRWGLGLGLADHHEVHADVEALVDVDPTRRYLTGYSAGGYATYLLGSLYPDRWAAAFALAPATLPGTWDGQGEDCGCSGTPDGWRDPNHVLVVRLLENLHQVPLVIDHGTNDVNVEYHQSLAVSERLQAEGYRYRLRTLPGQDHYTVAVIDDFDGAAAYIHQHTRADRDPRRVRYAVSPAMEAEMNRVVDFPELVEVDLPLAYDPDGAWWVDDVEARVVDLEDASVMARVDVESRALPGVDVTPTPGALPLDPAQPTTPTLVTEQTWTDGDALPVEDAWAATFENVGTVRLDTQRMGFTLAGDVVGSVTTDGPTAVTFDGLPPDTHVLLDGERVAVAGAEPVTVELAEGEAEVVFRRVTATAPSEPSEELPATGGGVTPLAAALLALLARRRRT